MKRISRLFILCALVVLAFGSCKKEDSPDNVVNNTVTPPDPHANDSIKLGGMKYTFSGRTNGIVNNKWAPTGTYNSGQYTIFIYTGASAAPASSTNFTIIPPTTPSVVPAMTGSQAYVYIANSATYESYQGGTLNVTVSGNTINLKILGATVSTTSTSTQFSLNVNLTLP